MKRRQFVSSAALAAAAMGTNPSAFAKNNPPSGKQVYELREYNLNRNTVEIDKWLTTALIPALNRAGVAQVGVWREWGRTEPPKLYVLIPYASLQGWMDVAAKLKADSAFQTASQAYNALPVTSPVYERFSTSLMIAFDGMSQIKLPSKSQRFFELRKYESYSDDAAIRKIAMFNKEEFPVFDRSGLHTVFFGQTISGDNMPNLIYMLCFDSLDERDANWKKFIDDPDWKRVSAMPEYANTVSKVIKIYLEPMPYSQI